MLKICFLSGVQQAASAGATPAILAAVRAAKTARPASSAALANVWLYISIAPRIKKEFDIVIKDGAHVCKFYLQQERTYI